MPKQKNAAMRKTVQSSSNEIPELKSEDVLLIKAGEVQTMEARITSPADYYTFDAFLKTFGICRNTAKKWMREKGLAHIRIDGIIFFNKVDVDAFFERFRKGSLLWIGWQALFVVDWEVLSCGF